MPKSTSGLSGITSAAPVLPAAPLWLEALYDAIPDTVFFIKDPGGRYVSANQTLVERLKAVSKSNLIGKTASQVFAGVLGERYAAQDMAVLRTGAAISGLLELHIYPGGTEGWCITWKTPVRDPQGRITGLAGLSRDLPNLSVSKPENSKLARMLDHMERKLDEPLRIAPLAAMAGLSPYRLDSRIKQLFGLSTAQLITQKRMTRACQMLRTGRAAISAIAQACGYGDQAAFTRQFRQSAGLTPLQYRKLSQG